MSVAVYKRSENERLSQHFSVSDFACRDGSAEVPVDGCLIELLELLIAFLSLSEIKICAGYRSVGYAKRIGREKDFLHTEGRAADIICYDLKNEIVPSKTVLCALEALGHRGGAAYASPEMTHVDTRQTGRCFYDETDHNSPVESFFGYFNHPCINPYPEPSRILHRYHRGKYVFWLQTALNCRGFCVTPDGDFGEETCSALRAFQEARRLPVTGEADRDTRDLLR